MDIFFKKYYSYLPVITRKQFLNVPVLMNLKIGRNRNGFYRFCGRFFFQIHRFPQTNFFFFFV